MALNTKYGILRAPVEYVRKGLDRATMKVPLDMGTSSRYTLCQRSLNRIFQEIGEDKMMGLETHCSTVYGVLYYLVE